MAEQAETELGGHESARRAQRARVVVRLRARRLEIEEEIFARVSDKWFDQTGSDDPEYVAGLRAAGAAALDYAFAGVERWGEFLAPIPAETLEQAQRAARLGVGLETVLRRYIAGHGVFEDFVMQEAERGVLRGHEPVLRKVLSILSALVDRLTAAVTSAYNKEKEAQVSEGSVTVPRGRGSGSDVTWPEGSAAVFGTASVASRRERIIDALVAVAAERGFAGTTVSLVSGRAGVSTRGFYEEVDGLRDCFIAVLDLGLERGLGLIGEAFERQERWQDGVLDALASLLVFFDCEPQLTRVWFVEALAAGSWALERREQNIALVRSMILESWSAPGVVEPEPLTASGVMAAILGLIHTHVVTKRPDQLIVLLGPLMRLITSPYLDAAGVEAEVARAEQLARAIEAGEDTRWTPTRHDTQSHEGKMCGQLPAELANLCGRWELCLLYISEHPDAANNEIATAVGIKHPSQISRLLSQLLQASLVVKHSGGQPGRRNAWRLTPKGQALARTVRHRNQPGPFRLAGKNVPTNETSRLTLGK